MASTRVLRVVLTSLVTFEPATLKEKEIKCLYLGVRWDMLKPADGELRATTATLDQAIRFLTEQRKKTALDPQQTGGDTMGALSLVLTAIATVIHPVPYEYE